MKTLRTAVGLLVVAAVAASACAPDDVELPTDASDENEDALSSVKAEAGAVRLTLQGAARYQDRDGERVLVIQGSANRDLANAFTWVPDDAFGETVMITKRKFEIRLRQGYEQNTILSGLPLMLTVHPVNGPTPDAYARISLGAQYARFSGSSTVFVEQPIRPVFVVSDVDDLRYRGEVSTTFPATSFSVTSADGDQASVTSASDQAFLVDWQFPAFRTAADPHTDDVIFAASDAGGTTKTKKAEIDIFVSSLEMTTVDPYEAWPAAGCDPAIYPCVDAVRSSGGTDFGACGDYRETKRCYQAQPGEICEIVGPSPFALDPVDASDELAEPTEQYNDGCASGGTWCSVGAVEVYTVPACLEEPASLEQALAHLESTDQTFLAGGSLVDRAALEVSSLFSSTYSDGGPGLLLGIDVVTGGGTIDGYLATSEVPCHNCTDFADYAVLFYPVSSTVVVVRGSHGYDS